jgi:hypothetical protein
MPAELTEGLPLEALNDRSDLVRLLETRRSASAKAMTGPGPSPEQLDRLLGIASRVPDHGKLTPWRFIVFEGDALDRAGEVLVARYAQLHPGHGEETLAQQRQMFSRAPCVVAVVSNTVADHPKIPEWEQVLSAGAVCQNLVVAATAMGLGRNGSPAGLPSMTRCFRRSALRRMSASRGTFILVRRWRHKATGRVRCRPA